MGKKKVIPRKIAGYKVPKALRRSRLLNHLLRSPVGREIIANALTAGATAAAAALVVHRDEIGEATAAGAKRGARQGKRTLTVLNRAARDGADAMMDVVADAARSVAGKDRDAGGRRDQRSERARKH